MTTFLENPHYYSSNIKSENVYETDKNEFNDFFVDHTSFAPVKSFCTDFTNWEYVVSQLRQQIFNSTGVSYPAPETYFIKKAKNEQFNSHAAAMLSMIDHNATFRFNSDPFCAADPIMYRKDRSENLLVRMIHCRNLDMSQISLMRLSRGVFVHQKWQSSSPQSSPTLSAIEESLSNRYIDTTAEAPIDTFQFDNVCNMVNHLTKSCYEMFIPYSYTFGARYTNPYGNANDLVIRGKLPLWCQTLFLSSCMKQTEPIRPNVPRLGLFPFAPHVPVTFTSLAAHDDSLVSPELTILYERFTMEHIDPLALPDIVEDQYECQWPEKRQEVLQNILICDLPDDLAKILSDMASVWAASQGLML